MEDREEIEKVYKASYMQNPFEILTKENLQRLEKHCKKAIHYERGEVKQEHEITLSLLYRYLEQTKMIDKMAKWIYEKDYNSQEIILICERDKDYYSNNIEKVKQHFKEKVGENK